MPYYIATNGSDANPGTLAEPFLTIAHAQAVVQAAIVGGMSETMRIYLRGGTYRITSGLTFGAIDSGRDGYKVIWQSYPGENAVIDGGEVIAGWTLHSGSIYKASVTPGRDFRSLFVNGAHVTRARGPNSPAGWTAAALGYTAPDASMASWGNKTAIEFVTKSGWQNVRGKVATIVGTAVTMQDPHWSLQVALRTWGIEDVPLWIENAYELMASGYWYLDKTTSTLYYWPPFGSMAGLTVVAPKAETLLTVDGASNLRFLNLAIHHSNWTAPETSGYGYFGNNNYIIDEDWFTTAHLPPPSVLVNGSSNIELRHIDFMHLGHPIAVSVLDSCQDVTITACWFDDNAGAPVQVGTSDAAAASQEHGILVYDNYIGPNNFYDFQSGAGLHMASADESQFTHNEFDLGALGWSALVSNGSGDGVLSSNVISNNYVHRSTAMTYLDGASIQITEEQSEAGGYDTGLTIEGNCLEGNFLPGAGYHGHLYLDFDVDWVTANNNLMRGGSWYYWLFNSQATAHDCKLDGNIHDGMADYIRGTDIDVSGTETIAEAEPAYGTRAYAIKRAAGISWGVRPGAQPNAYPQKYPAADNHTLASESPWPKLGTQ